MMRKLEGATRTPTFERWVHDQVRGGSAFSVKRARRLRLARLGWGCAQRESEMSLCTPLAPKTKQPMTESPSAAGMFGGDEGTRTLGLCLAKAALSQLSYIPIGVARENAQALFSQFTLSVSIENGGRLAVARHCGRRTAGPSAPLGGVIRPIMLEGDPVVWATCRMRVCLGGAA